MKLKLPRRNKRWQATWPESLSVSKSLDGSAVGAFTPVEGVRVASPKLRRMLTSLMVVVVVVLLGLVAWLSYQYQEGVAQSALEDTSASAAGEVRAQMLNDVQTLQLLITDSTDARNAGSTQRLKERVERLMQDRPDVVRMQWWRVPPLQTAELTLEIISGAAPESMKSVGQSLNSALSSETLAALESGRAINKAQFSQPYFLSLPNNVGFEAMDLWVPRAQADSVVNELRLTYSLSTVIEALIDPETLKTHDLSITLTDGTTLARRQVSKRAAIGEQSMSLIDIPGVPLQLRATNFKTAQRFIPSFLSTLVFVLGGLLITSLLFLLGDVRKRLSLQRALQQQNALRKAMEDSLVTGLRARDMSGFVTYVNPAFCTMVGLQASELVGRGPPMPYWAPEATQEYQARHANLLAGTISKEGFETVFMRSNGERLPVMIFEAPLLNASGKQTGWMSSIVDVTAQQRAEATALQQQEQLASQARLATMGEISSSLSHELNQPLAAISSYATGTLNMIQSGAATANDIQDGLTRIAKQAQRAGQVIRSVSDFVRRKAPVREVIDLRSVINGIYPLIDLQAKQSGVAVVMHLAQYVPDVLADRLMIEQVMLNLTRNAVDAMKTVPAAQRRMDIEVRAHINDGALKTRFAVSDRGAGIADEVGANIFSPFFSTKSDGMGMGLAICRSVVEAASGRLWFEPREGGGCVFIVELPALINPQ